MQNYPNPFNPVTKIKFMLKENGFVTMKIYDVLGKEVANIINENLKSGTYEIPFNAGQLSSGIYFYKLQSGDFSDIKKMVVIK
jgi:hypothetical protein